MTDWKKECLKKGFEYVREPDDHYLIASVEEMAELLGDILGIEVRTKEGDSYGESVENLKEQINGLANVLHLVDAENAELRAKLATPSGFRLVPKLAADWPLNVGVKRLLRELNLNTHPRDVVYFTLIDMLTATKDAEQ